MPSEKNTHFSSNESEISFGCLGDNVAMKVLEQALATGISFVCEVKDPATGSITSRRYTPRNDQESPETVTRLLEAFNDLTTAECTTVELLA